MTPSAGDPALDATVEPDFETALIIVLAEQEAERKRLGDLIHDRPLQALAAAVMQIDALLMRGGVSTGSDELRAAQDRVRKAGADLRDLLPDLVPLVDTSALGRALERRLAQQTEADIDPASGSVLNMESALALLRSADDVVAAAAGDKWTVRVAVTDDGVNLQIVHSADAPVATLLALLRGRLAPHGGTADAKKGPEGPFIAAWLPRA